MRKKVTIIGAGNLGTRVSCEFYYNGIEIVQVYNRTASSAQTLAKLFSCSYVTTPDMITSDADIYIISVNDHAYGELLNKIKFHNKLVVHTAGSISMNVLKKNSNNYGVFYPLQTFSKYREINFSDIPICIEANSAKNEKILIELASVISKDVRIVNSEQRKHLHLAAVFACNFVNQMYTIAAEIVEKKDLPFDILKPLIDETASKVATMSPITAQTGPASRNDRNIINEHLNMLSNNPKLKELYIRLSELIIESHNIPK